MEIRNVGPTDLRVSLLGFGCAPIASRAGFAESRRALDAAREAGLTFFDTADMYGVGGSERTLARVLGDGSARARDGVVVSTKCGFRFSSRLKAVAWVKPLLRPLVTRLKSVKASAAAIMTSQKSMCFDPEYIEACVHGSLARLATDRLDILFLHEPPMSIVGRADTFAKLADLKRAGKVRQFGISCDPDVAAAALATEVTQGMSVIQVNANVLEHAALTTVLPQARARGIGVIARQPFAHRDIFTDPKLRASLAGHGLPTDPASVSSFALRYLRAFDGISAILPSMMDPRHLRSNVAAFDQPGLNAAELKVVVDLGAPLPRGTT